MSAVSIIPHHRDRAEVKAERRRVHYAELGSLTIDALNAIHPGGAERFVFYRLKGYSQASSLKYARAWARNSAEQAERRCAHETGYERPASRWAP